MILSIWLEKGPLLSDSRTRSQCLRDEWVMKVLAKHLEIPGETLQIRREEGKKPRLLRLAQPFGDFSLSHSGEAIALAWSDHLTVGVDLEELRPLASAAHLVERYFSEEEREEFERAPEERKNLIAIQGWTRHEAVFKALGTGVRGMGEPVRFHPLSGGVWLARIEAHEFRVEEISCPSGFTGSIAYSSREPVKLQIMNLSSLN